MHGIFSYHFVLISQKLEVKIKIKWLKTSYRFGKMLVIHVIEYTTMKSSPLKPSKKSKSHLLSEVKSVYLSTCTTHTIAFLNSWKFI